MHDASALRPSRRSTFTLDLGAALRSRLDAAAAAASRSPSQFTRELLTHSLAAQDGEQATKPPASTTGPDARAVSNASRRIELDFELAAKLDAYKVRGGFRSRPAAIRFALETATQYRNLDRNTEVNQVAGNAPVAAREFQPLDPAWLKDATRALIESNSALQPIGNNLNQIARSLNAMPGLLNADDARHIAEAQKQIRAHVEQAGRLVHSLRTYITPFTGT